MSSVIRHCRNGQELSLPALLALSDEQLAMVDPLVMNLIVAKGIARLENLDITQRKPMTGRRPFGVKRNDAKRSFTRRRTPGRMTCGFSASA